MAGARFTIAAIVWLGLAPAVAGCAARPPSNRFIIREGHGPMDAGHLTPESTVHKEAIERASREAIAVRAARRPETLPSIERVDAGLRRSLAALGRRETADGHVAVAQDYFRLGVYDAAYDHYSDALRLDPKNAAAYDGRARVWRQWGMIESALSDIHHGLFYEPSRPDLKNTLGTILEAAGQCDEAREAYEGALKLDPSAAWARSNLERLRCNPSNPSNPPNLSNLPNLSNPSVP